MVDPHAPTNVVSETFHVPFAIGDDAEKIIESTTAEPIFIFNHEGQIIEVVEPQAGEKTTRDVVIRLLGKKGSP